MTTAMSLRTFSHGHRDVDALRRADRVRVRSLVEGPHLVGPHAGGVDHDRRGDLAPPRRPPPRWPRRPGPRPCESHDAGPVERDRAMLGGRARDRQAEPGVVGPGVVVEVRRGQPVGRQRRHVGQAASFFRRWWSLPIRAPPVRSYIHRAVPSARASLAFITPSFVSIGIRNGSTCTRCGALWRRRWRSARPLVHEAHVALLEVAEAAVDELGALRRGAGGEVVALDEGGPQPAGGGVEGGADAGDAAADDQDVEASRPRRSSVGARRSRPSAVSVGAPAGACVGGHRVPRCWHRRHDVRCLVPADGQASGFRRAGEFTVCRQQELQIGAVT